MAIDQTSIALDITSILVNKVTQLMETIDDIEEEIRHATKAGIVFTDYDTDYEASGELSHINGALINQLKNDVFGPLGIRNFISITLSGLDTYEKVLYEISR